MKIYFHKSSLLLITLLMVNYGCFSVRSNEHFTYSKISPAAYDSLLNNTKDYYLIDVRTKREYNKSHIDQAANYSFLAFHFRHDVRRLERNKPVFIYCHTCHRSPLAARKLKKMGFRTVYDLKGGYQKWKPVSTTRSD